MMMTEQRKPQRGVPVQRHHWAAVLEWAGVAALVVYLGAALAQHEHVTAWLPAGAAALAGAVATVLLVVITSSLGLAAAAGAATVYATAWLAWVLATARVWTTPAVGAMVVGGGLLAAWWLVAWGMFTDDTRAEAERAAAAEAARELAQWGDMLARLGVDGVRATRVDEIAAGRVITLRLPDSGKVTYTTLKSLTEQVATARHLRADAVFFEQGRHSGLVLLHLIEHDYLADAVPLPDLPGPASISDLLDVGIDGVGREAMIRWRELGCLITGVTGAGKTNLLHVLIARFTACVDTIVLVIDLKGGRLAAPWIKPWVDGECPRPAVDWVATTRAEAQAMLRAIDAVITARGESLAGGSKLTPSPANPQFILIVDETADLTGNMPTSEQADGVKNSTMAWLAGRIARKQRSEAVMAVWATQRGVSQATGTSEIKSQCKLRISLATSSEADARSVTDDMQVAKMLPQLQHAGSGVVQMPGDRSPLPVKFYRLDPDLDQPHGEGDLRRIYSLARKAGHTRPAPDQVALRAMGTTYTDRWNASPLYQALVAAGQPGAVAVDDTGAVTQGGTPGHGGTATVADDRAVFAELMASAGLGGTKPDPRQRMYALLAEKPTFGMGVADIVAQLKKDGMPVTRETVHRWLEADVSAGDVEQVGKRGTRDSRYRLSRRRPE